MKAQDVVAGAASAVVGALALFLAPYCSVSAAAETTRIVSALTVPTPDGPDERPTTAEAPFLDARTTPASTRAPVITVDPATLPDFALFRECEGCPEMVVIPAGTFLMGSPADEPSRVEDEHAFAGRSGEPVSVNLPRFAISRFESTWSEWRACVTDGICDQGPIDALESERQWARDAIGWGLERRPVVLVDWNDASAFAGWVNDRASAHAYRRPTEAEWEYAARAGTATRWSFGDAENELGQYAWFSENANRRTQPVGGKGANPWGLFDMHGNVSEWVEDCFRDNLSGESAAAFSPPSCFSRVLRGGPFFNSPSFLRSAFRDAGDPGYRFSYVGFRLARTL